MNNYPQEPGFRSNAPETSAAAAKVVKESAKAIREQVQKALANGAMTAHEVADFLRRREPVPVARGTAIHERFKRSVQSRISELCGQGIVEDSGLRRKNESSVNAVVWKLKGFQKYSQIGLL